MPPAWMALEQSNLLTYQELAGSTEPDDGVTPPNSAATLLSDSQIWNSQS
jgi:hypothetical protein